MNYRNNPGTGNQQNDWHGGQRLAQEPFSKSSGAKSSGFSFGGNLPTMPPASQQAQDILPVVVPDTAAELIESTTSTKASGFSLANLGEIKGYIDRLGGIDGILTTVTKVQKVMSSVSQMAPLVKVLMGSFGKKSKESDDDDSDEWKPKRRKRRKPRAGSGSGKKTVRRRRTAPKKR